MPDLSAVMDQSLPTIDVLCPECGHKRAIYFLIPDEGETKMIARLMCKNVAESTIKCGHIWDLNDESEITDLTVKVKEEEDLPDSESFDEKKYE